MRLERKRIRLAVTAIAIGVSLPLLTWGFARAIDDRLVFEDFPDPVLLGFNGVAFAALAFASLYLPRAAALGGLLALAAISVHLHMSYWQSHSSTAALLFLFYLPWAGIATAIGMTAGLVSAVVLDRARAPGIALVVILLLAYGVVNVRLSNYGRFSLPAEVGVVEKLVAGIEVEKTLFFRTEERIGALTAVDRRGCSGDPEATLTLTGRGGAAFVTETGVLRGFVKFEKVAGFDVFPVDVEGDGICEFADRAGGWQPVGLIDSGGAYVFRYGKDMTGQPDEKLVEIAHSPQDFIPFDLGGDGRTEFLVPLLIVGHDETHVLDPSGRRIRTLPENLEGSRVLEGKLYSPFQGELVVRDGELAVVGKLPLGRGAPFWDFVRWPTPSSGWHLAVLDRKTLRLLDLQDGVERGSIPVEGANELAFLGKRAVIVRAENRRQFLKVIDDEAETLYEEVLEPGGALFATSDDSFLISECTRERCPTLWSYRLP